MGVYLIAFASKRVCMCVHVRFQLSHPLDGSKCPLACSFLLRSESLKNC